MAFQQQNIDLFGDDFEEEEKEPLEGNLQNDLNKIRISYDQMLNVTKMKEKLFDFMRERITYQRLLQFIENNFFNFRANLREPYKQFRRFFFQTTADSILTKILFIIYLITDNIVQAAYITLDIFNLTKQSNEFYNINDNDILAHLDLMKQLMTGNRMIVGQNQVQYEGMQDFFTTYFSIRDIKVKQQPELDRTERQNAYFRGEIPQEQLIVIDQYLDQGNIQPEVDDQYGLITPRTHRYMNQPIDLEERGRLPINFDVRQVNDDGGIAKVLQVLGEIKRWRLKAELEQISVLGTYDRELMSEYIKFLDNCKTRIKSSFQQKLKTNKSAIDLLVEPN